MVVPNRDGWKENQQCQLIMIFCLGRYAHACLDSECNLCCHYYKDQNIAQSNFLRQARSPPPLISWGSDDHRVSRVDFFRTVTAFFTQSKRKIATIKVTTLEHKNIFRQNIFRYEILWYKQLLPVPDCTMHRLGIKGSFES